MILSCEIAALQNSKKARQPLCPFMAAGHFEMMRRFDYVFSGIRQYVLRRRNISRRLGRQSRLPPLRVRKVSEVVRRRTQQGAVVFYEIDFAAASIACARLSNWTGEQSFSIFLSDIVLSPFSLGSEFIRCVHRT